MKKEDAYLYCPTCAGTREDMPVRVRAISAHACTRTHIRVRTRHAYFRAIRAFHTLTEKSGVLKLHTHVRVMRRRNSAHSQRATRTHSKTFRMYYTCKLSVIYHLSYVQCTHTRTAVLQTICTCTCKYSSDGKEKQCMNRWPLHVPFLLPSFLPVSGNQFSQVSELSLGWQDFPQGSHDCLLHPVRGLIARGVRGGSGLHLGVCAITLLLDCRL